MRMSWDKYFLWLNPGHKSATMFLFRLYSEVPDHVEGHGDEAGIGIQILISAYRRSGGSPALARTKEHALARASESGIWRRGSLRYAETRQG